MKHTRQILAVTLVAAALCADRVVASAPVIRPEMTETARQIVRKLAVSFRQTVPTVRFQESREDRTSEVVGESNGAITVAIVHAHEGTPFQFRLPPPTV